MQNWEVIVPFMKGTMHDLICSFNVLKRALLKRKIWTLFEASMQKSETTIFLLLLMDPKKTG